MLCHALAPTWDQLTGSTDFRRATPVRILQATPCGANDPWSVPEYQPDVHRLRLSSSA